MILSPSPIGYTGIRHPSVVIALSNEGVSRRRKMFETLPEQALIIRADGVIVHIARLNPGDLREAMPPVPVNYVLEMPQGWFAEHGAGPGSTVAIP